MSWRNRRRGWMGSRAREFLGPVVVLFCGMIGCDRASRSSGQNTAQSVNVQSVALAIGTCDDLAICEKECDAGSADRCRRLGATYALGRGADKDETRATALYEQACRMTDPSACVFAGQMHEYAHGVPKDAAKAVSFYERACDLQWAAGCYNLAIMYENGRGVPLDRSKAAAEYRVACTAGAKQACDKAGQLLEPAEVPLADGSTLK